MTSTTSAGTKIRMSAALPATENESGYEALTYTVIKGAEAIPAFGAQVAVNSFQPLDGPEEKHKGPVNYGGIDLAMAYDGDDAGQALLQTAAEPDNNAEYTFEIELSNGDKAWSVGRVFGAQINVGSATNVLMLNTRIEFNRKFITAPAA